MTLTIDVDDRRLIAALTAFPDRLAVDLRIVAHDTAERIAAGARSRVHVFSGRTRAAIQVAPARDGEGSVVHEAGREHVARFLEFGTRYMVRRPFLFDVVRMEEPIYDREVRDTIEAVIAREGFAA